MFSITSKDVLMYILSNCCISKAEVKEATNFQQKRSKHNVTPPNSSSRKIKLRGIHPAPIFHNFTEVPSFTISVNKNISLRTK